MATLELQIDKMHCGACIRRVTQTLNGLPSTHAQAVALGAATVTTDGPSEPLLEALATAGFPSRLVSSQA